MTGRLTHRAGRQRDGGLSPWAAAQGTAISAVPGRGGAEPGTAPGGCEPAGDLARRALAGASEALSSGEIGPGDVCGRIKDAAGSSVWAHAVAKLAINQFTGTSRPAELAAWFDEASQIEAELALAEALSGIGALISDLESFGFGQ